MGFVVVDKDGIVYIGLVDGNLYVIVVGGFLFW